MASPGIAVPGTTVPVSSQILTGGAQGIQGAQGLVSNGFVSKSSTFAIVSGDNGRYFICVNSGSSPITAILPSAIAGFAFYIRNDGGITGSNQGAITLSPPSPAQIDGLNSINLLPGQDCMVACDGTNWRTFGLKRTLVVGTIDITAAVANQIILLPVGYREFDIDFINFVPATDQAVLQMVFSVDGGSTFLSGAYYDGIIYSSSGTAVAYSYAAATAGNNRLSCAAQAVASRASQTKLRLVPNLASGSQTLTWLSQSTGYQSGIPLLTTWAGSGAVYNISTGVVNAMRINYSGGNINAGSIIVRGTV